MTASPHFSPPRAAFRRRLAPLLLLTALLAGCAAGPLEQAPPAAKAPLPPAPASVAGRYRLSDIGGHALPVLVGDDGGCAVAVDSGELSLQGGIYELTRTTSRTCDGIVMARTVARSRGAYGGTAAALVLVAHGGQMFRRARASVHGDTLLLRPHLDTQAAAAGPWTFERAR